MAVLREGPVTIDDLRAKYDFDTPSVEEDKLVKGEDGQYYRYDPSSKTLIPVQGMPPPVVKSDWSLETGNDGRQYWVNSRTQEVKPATGLGDPKPPQPPQRAPQTQAEMDADAARARLYAAQATGAERDLLNPYVLKQQQVAETIQSIQEQMARGEITPDEGNKMMLLARQNLDAAMRGTTPYQMENDRLTREQTRRTQQQNLAQNFVADRGQLGGSMATGLLSGLGGIYGKILGGTNPPIDMDPLAMGSAFASQQYGGPELNDMALAILRSALGQGGM